MPRPTGETHPARLKKLESMKQAFLLRLSGYSYVRISEEMNCSKAWAHKLVSQGMDEYRVALRQTVDELRALELARMDSLLSKLAVPMSKGDVSAVRAAVRISEHRSNLLGLYPQPPARQQLPPDGDTVPTLPNGAAGQATVVFYLPENFRDTPRKDDPSVIEHEANGDLRDKAH